MSRIGKLPIELPEKVTVDVTGTRVTVKGPLGQLFQEIHPDIIVKLDGNNLIVERPSEQKEHKSMHGLYRDRKSVV